MTANLPNLVITLLTAPDGWVPTHSGTGRHTYLPDSYDDSLSSLANPPPPKHDPRPDAIRHALRHFEI